MAEQKASIQLVDGSESREPLCAQHATGLMMTRDQSIHLASQLRALCDLAAGAAAEPDADLCFPAGVGGAYGQAAPDSQHDSSLRGILSQGAIMLGRTPGAEASRADCSAHGPRVLDRALERASGGLIEVLNRGSGVELWCENRSQAPCFHATA
jgi:hypothetical protein